MCVLVFAVCSIVVSGLPCAYSDRPSTLELFTREQGDKISSTDALVFARRTFHTVLVAHRYF